MRTNLSLLSTLVLAAGMSLTVQDAASAAPPPTRTKVLRSSSSQERRENIAKGEAACAKDVLSVPEMLTLGFEWSRQVSDLLNAGCIAAVERRGDLCSRYSGENDADNRRVCADISGEVLMIWTALRDRGAFACTLLSDKEPPASPQTVNAVCRAYMAAVADGQSELICKEAMAADLTKSEIAGCARYFIYLKGQPALCGGAGTAQEHALSASDQTVCREKAALVAALRSGRPEDCAASPLCKALSGRDPRACAPYAAEAKNAFCSAIAKAKAEEASAQKKKAAPPPDAAE